MPKKFDPTNQARRETVADIVAALMWKPKTIHEVIAETGCAETTARSWVHALHAAGVVRIAERLPREKSEGAIQYGCRRIVWEWQTTPFLKEDIPA